MKNFIKEFKEFAVKGNAIDLAVGVIIGTAFSKIISSIVADIITPVLSIFTGKISFASMVFTVSGSEIKYGNFLEAAINFILVALILFLFVKTVNRLKRKQEAHPSPAMMSKQEILLTEIRDLLKGGHL